MHRTIRVLVAIAGGTIAAHAAGQTYEFTIDPLASGLSATTTFAAETSGTLIGNWTPDTNPSGTRTKPGLFGSFGSTENLPVALDLGLSLGGGLETRTSGSFSLTLDTGLGTVVMRGLSADFLASGPAALPATISLAPESFRTRAPDSAYLGVPLDLPIGDLALTALTASQIDGGALGVLTPVGPDTYDFAVAPLVELAGAAEFLGTPLDIPPSPTALVISGTVVITGDTALVTALQTIDQSEVQNPNQEIPEFPLDLPTILPPGEIAHVLMNLVLTEVASSTTGTATLNASGLPACRADFNGDGSVNTIDVLTFLNAWSAGDASADFNADGSVNTLDVLAFLNTWSAGC